MSTENGQEKKQNEAVKVTSIARKINFENVYHLFTAYLAFDVLVCVLLAVVFIYGMDMEMIGEFSITYSRKLLFGTSLRDVVYQVGKKGDSYFYQIEIGNWLLWLGIAGIAVVACQLLELVGRLINGTADVRKKLRPLNELAAKAQELSELAFQEAEPDETKYHNLEDAISNLKVEKPDARIRMHDKELEGIETALNDLLERMRASYKQQVQFVSDASHELRTPIAVIQGYVNMLDRWGKDDEAILTESIEAIKNESTHMQKLVEQLLFLARGDSNRQTLDMQMRNLNDIMREVYEESLMIDEKHHYIFEESGNAFVYGDADMLKQSARILIDNAAKYTSEGEDITIRVGNLAPEGVPFYGIQDNGIGMSCQDVEHAFDRFYRADAVRGSSTGGTGLGLSIAKWIVEKHQGYYDIVSREGLGTRFNVIFPQNNEKENKMPH